ncbi:glycosyltransferase family 4 protein [Halobaculum sp. EA56]|uniref:glycosyltransferase family 4 protein n=1 Tax=Halobaculum sp. EA56 TaxID=3421648 RepID=UPI003EC08F6D
MVYPFVKGGVEKRIHEIGRRLSNRGHDVTIYSRHWWDGPQDHIHEGMNLKAIAPETELYAAGDRRSISSALGLSVRSVIPLIGNSHDVIATPVAPYFHVFPASLIGNVNKTPTVVTWHEVWGSYWYRYIGKLGQLGRGIEWATARLPQHAICPSQSTANRLSSLNSDIEYEVIPNGIDINDISQTPSAVDGFDVLFVGRLIKDKKVDMLIDAFSMCNDDASLGIIGEGPELDSLKAHADNTKRSSQIQFLGFLDSYDEVIAHMRAAKVFVSPSIREGFGITLLEAMATDCTVITVEHEYSAGSEIVDGAGFVVEPNVSALSSTISRALNGEKPDIPPKDRASEFDWDIITDQTESFYEKII